MPDPSTRRVAIALLHYWRDHPAASDTADGIAKWWANEDLATVEKALIFLVKEDVVVEEGGRYSLASAKASAQIIDKAMRKLRKGKH